MPSSAVHDHGERWDDSDVAALKQHLASGKTHKLIAEVIGRTKVAVDSKVKRLRRQGLL